MAFDKKRFLQVLAAMETTRPDEYTLIISYLDEVVKSAIGKMAYAPVESNNASKFAQGYFHCAIDIKKEFEDCKTILQEILSHN